MSTKKLIIEARINEYAMRDCNPHVPWTPEEIAADAAECRANGAAIVHFHARKPDGAPELSARKCGEIIRRIRESSDVLINPTLGSVRSDLSVHERLAPVLELASDPATRPDLLPLAMASPNWDFFDSDTRRLTGTTSIFRNATSDLIASSRTLAAEGIGLSFVCWEIGSTRRLAAFLDAGIAVGPAYAVFHLTSGGMLAGHPGTPEGLRAHLAFLPTSHEIEWAVINLHGSMMPLAEMIIREAGHIQIGIGDHHYQELNAPRNGELVGRIAEVAARMGREIATPDDARQILNLGHGRPAAHTSVGTEQSVGDQ